MEEGAIREKLKDGAKKEKEKARSLAISEKNKRMDAVIIDIKKELAKWEKDLPLNLEEPDNISFANMNRQPHFLFKKRDTKEIIVIRYASIRSRRGIEKITIERTIDACTELLYSRGAEEALIKLRERIPAFIEYLNTKKVEDDIQNLH